MARSTRESAPRDPPDDGGRPPDTTELAGEAFHEPRGARERHAELFQRVAARIFHYFERLVWDRHEAEELAQQTLLLLETSLREKTYDPGRSFNGWMWVKAHTVFAQWCRARRARPTAVPEKLQKLQELQKRVDSHEREVALRLDAERILRAVQERLGDETYEILVLAYQGELSQVEIAEAVGLARKTVASRLRDARALATELLEGKPKP